LLQSSPEYHAALIARNAPPAEQVEAVITKCEKEQKAGILGDWHSKEFFNVKYGEKGWRGMPRFPVWQSNSEDWRVIDNGLASGHNEVMSFLERIHTATNELGFAVFQMLLVWSRALLHDARLFRGTRDMKSAYRQLARLMSQAHLHIICAWVPGLGWQFANY
jgi:hypothetical protein